MDRICKNCENWLDEANDTFLDNDVRYCPCSAWSLRFSTITETNRVKNQGFWEWTPENGYCHRFLNYAEQI